MNHKLPTHLHSGGIRCLKYYVDDWCHLLLNFSDNSLQCLHIECIIPLAFLSKKYERIMCVSEYTYMEGTGDPHTKNNTNNNNSENIIIIIWNVFVRNAAR